jgi:hypothetical protein
VRHHYPSALPRAIDATAVAGSRQGEEETPEGAFGESPSSCVAGNGRITGWSPRRADKEARDYRGSGPLLPFATRPSVFPFRGAVGDLYETTVVSEFQWMNLGNSQVHGVEITIGVLITRNTVVFVGAEGASRRWRSPSYDLAAGQWCALCVEKRWIPVPPA